MTEPRGQGAPATPSARTLRPLVRPQPSAALLAWGVVGLFVGAVAVVVGLAQDDGDSSGTAWLVLGTVAGTASVVALTVAAHRPASSIDMLAAGRYEDDRASGATTRDDA
jgi:hypothetical protein